MSEVFGGRFRIASARLRGFDYANPGSYMITICTNRRLCFFGDIKNGKMHLSPLGDIAHDAWRQISTKFPFVFSDDWIVMPNHIHGILTIAGYRRRDAINCVSTDTHSEPRRGGITGDHNPLLHQNISTVIRWYKGYVTYMIRKIDKTFSWQPRFHDRIIRNNEELGRITKYIQNNPENWEADALFNEFQREESRQ